jgi:hemoglobin
MTLFYTKAMDNEELGPFFIHELGSDITSEDWVEHIELLADFWLAKMLGHNTYKGNIAGGHIKVPYIKRETFAIWLELFGESTDDVYTKEISNAFKKKGREFSEQFMLDLNL